LIFYCNANIEFRFRVVNKKAIKKGDSIEPPFLTIEGMIIR